MGRRVSTRKPHFFRAEKEGRYWWFVQIGYAVYGGWDKLPFGEDLRWVAR